jgi:YD repeat-containing protein
MGQVTRTEYGPFDAPTARIGPDGTRLEFGYDSELRLNAVTNPQGLRWRYTYDGAGQAIHYAYDVLGNVVRAGSEGRETTFAYDPGDAWSTRRTATPSCPCVATPLGRIVAETVNGRVLHSV